MTGPTGQPLHTIQPPPDTDPDVSAAITILQAYASYKAISAALAVLLAPYGIGKQAILAALLLTRRSTNDLPRPVGYHQIARDQSRRELSFRAAYLLRAAGRIQRDLDAGKTLQDAIAHERTYQRAHDAARRQRQAAIRQVVAKAKRYGVVLGWYLDPHLNNEAECQAAHGHNFDALLGTMIGYPGTVHAGCGCRAGPPFEGAGWVDDAVFPYVQYGAAVPVLRYA